MIVAPALGNCLAYSQDTVLTQRDDVHLVDPGANLTACAFAVSGRYLIQPGRKYDCPAYEDAAAIIVGYAMNIGLAVDVESGGAN